MNDKDKEAFRLWAGEEEGESLLYDGAAFHTWQAACEYMQAELAHHIFKIEAENKKLRTLIDDLVNNGMDNDIATRLEKLEDEGT
jgi:hypothetical protein